MYSKIRMAYRVKLNNFVINLLILYLIEIFKIAVSLDRFVNANRLLHSCHRDTSKYRETKFTPSALKQN
jgi:hypothetical protein